MSKTRPFTRSSSPLSIRDWNVWLIEVYVDSIRLDETRRKSIMDARIADVETNLLSPEYAYLRIGFFVFHYGRRGTTISLWHWGKWGDTFEAFNHAWYCYNDDFQKLEALDAAEPVFCNLDVEIIANELLSFKCISDGSPNPETIKSRYLKDLSHDV